MNLVTAAACLTLASILFWGPSPAPAQSRKQALEVVPHFKDWLERDVVYIISPEERDVFLKLTTDEERERFVEQFWARRDSDPNSAHNEFREEHYRRIQYANERFHAGIPGWRTDRGRIYIVFGPPDRVESHPVGGQYLRTPEEGGGQTSTYPFERWEYRHLEGIGDDIEIEFVDVSGGNLYKITTNPFEKDELLHVPGMGLTDREKNPAPNEDPVDLRRSRVLGIRDAGSAKRMGIFGERAKYSPFARAELAANLSKPPAIRFPDLREKVAARVTYDAIPLELSYHALRLAGKDALVPLVLSVENRALTFQKEYEALSNRLQVYAVATSLTGSRVFEFDDEIAVAYTAREGRLPEHVLQQQTLYRRPLSLPPGRYKLDAVVREVPTGRMGAVTRGITVPDLSSEEKLQISPIVLATELEQLRSDRFITQDFILGEYKIRPNIRGIYQSDDYLAVYSEVYDYSVDPSSGTPSVKVEYAITPKESREAPIFRDITRGIVTETDRILVPRQIILSSYTAGEYLFHLRVTDEISGRTVTSNASFLIR